MTVGEWGLRVEVRTDVAPATLDEVVREPLTMRAVVLAGEIPGKIDVRWIQKSEQRAEVFLFAAMRGGRHEDQMAVGISRELLDECVPLLRGAAESSWRAA